MVLLQAYLPVDGPLKAKLKPHHLGFPRRHIRLRLIASCHRLARASERPFMRFVLGVLAAGAVLGLAVAPASASEAMDGRAGIVRVQADSGTGDQRDDPQAEAGRGEPQPPPSARRNDEDPGDGSNDEDADPFLGDRDPPGCTYRQGPLDLIV